MQALCGFTSEARWLRHARTRLRHLFRYLPQPGYNRRLRACASLVVHVIRALAVDTSLWTDDVWVVDSTPVECGGSRQTARRSELAGWAEYGYRALHSRYFWGLRLHLLCTGSAGRLRAPRRQGRRTSGAAGHLRRRLDPARRPARANPDWGQELLRPRVRGRPGPVPASGYCARPARTSPTQPARTCSNPSARPSSRSTRPSKVSSTWNGTAGTPSLACLSASCNASSR